MDPYQELVAREPALFLNPPQAEFEVVTGPAEMLSEVATAEGERLGHPVDLGLLYEDEYVRLLKDVVRFSSGRLGTYIRVLPAGSSAGVAVLPLLDGDVVLIRHFRHATRQRHWEIPRGFADNDESAADAARRELREELGVDTDALHAIGTVHPDTGILGGSTELFVAEIATIGELDGDEAITEAKRVSPGTMAELIRDGQVTDSFTIAAYTRATLHALIR
jgi:ADP-ribose pyrophosphatase